MIDVIEKIKQAYEISTTQIDRIIIDNTPYRIMNVDYSDDCYDEGNIFGTAIARMLEFEIENIIDLEKKEIEYQTGIYVDNEILWISLGNFIVQDIEPNDTTNINKVTSMDYMLKSNVPYASKLDYQSVKITMLDVAQEACQIAGLELATTNFANSNFIVDSNQFEEGVLTRDVFKAIAQMSGTFAKIRSDNKLHFVTPKRTNLLVKEVHKMSVKDLNNLTMEKILANGNKYSKSEYKELIIKRKTHPINLVSLGMSEIEGENVTLRDEKSIAEDGENSLVINDNPFAYTQEKREQLITALFEKVKGFEYTAFEIEGQAKPYQETGDEVLVVDKNNNICQSFLFRFRYKSPNGLESEMSAPSLTKATVNYQNVPSAIDIAKRTERLVDKQEQRILDIAEEQTETSNKLSEHEQTIEGITDTVSKVETKLENDYYTKTETNTQITQKSDSIVSEVNKSITSAKEEAINSANNSTDEKLKKYPTSEEMNSKIEQTAEEITSNVNKTVEGIKDEAVESANASTDEKLKDYYSKTETDSKITQSADNITTTVNKNINTAKQEAIESANDSTNSKLKDYSTTIQMNSAIKQAADSITTEVNKKVNNSEFGTKLRQSATDIQMAWNNISQYIQFISASLRILDSSEKLLLRLNSSGLYLYETDGSTVQTKLDRNGQSFYNSGVYTGYIGATRYINDSFQKGLAFNLAANGKFMCWGKKANDNDTSYITKLYYATANSFGTEKEGVYLGSDFFLNTRDIMVDDSTAITSWTDGGGFKAWHCFFISGGVNNTLMKIDSWTPEAFFYCDLDMSGHNIINAGNVASDGRLKKNIYSSKINALDRTMQMKIRDFNWKKDNKEDFGFIAQELKKIDERYVQHNYKEDEEGNIIQDSYELRPIPLIATNTKAIQELKEIIDIQQKRINMLMEKLNIQQDVQIKKEDFIEEQETVFEGEVIMEKSKILTPAPKYNTVMKYVNNDEIEIHQELAQESEV